MEEMKTWQMGYQLETLKEIEALYVDYNKYSASPFAQYKKNDIAKDLAERKLELVYDDNGAIVFGRVLQRVKAKSPITLYQDIVIGWKTPGDVVVTRLIGTPEGVVDVLNGLYTENVWLYTWAEDTTHDNLIEDAGFKYVGGKVTTYGEIYSIWFRDSTVRNNSLYEDNERVHPELDPIEDITLNKITTVNFCIIQSVKETLANLAPQFAKSGLTSYINKAWTALSLRGYSTDPTLICKPSEMPDKWLEKNKGNYSDELVDTTLYEHFPQIKGMIHDLLGPDVELHRISFMRLSKQGTLNRHTDQIDKEHGLSVGQLGRLHFPIQTNDKVTFIAWHPTGTKIEKHMKEGECWFLDTRKPHMVISESDEDRIHLTVDYKITPNTQKFLLTGESYINRL